MNKKNNITKQARFLIRGLFLFALLYVSFFALGGLLLWFSYISVRHKFVYGIYPYDLPSAFPILLFTGAVVLIYKMIQSLSAIKKINRPDLQAVTRDEYPDLFRLVDEIAASLQMKPPCKVYLSATVSASVFLPIGQVNIFRPSQKRLEIGVGLINVLNIEELRAVLTHELGHFSQKNTSLNVPVYIAGQNVQYLLSKVEIKKRGAFEAQSYMFIYIFRLLSEYIFAGLSGSFDSFSAESEYDADATALRHTSRSALMSALLKVSFASGLFDFTMNSLRILSRSGKSVTDFYAAQYAVIHAFLQSKDSNWNTDFITAPLPGAPLSSLSQKRLEIIRSSAESAEISGNHVPATALLNNFDELCLRFTKDIYRHWFDIQPETLSVCNKDTYAKWIAKYFRQSNTISVQPEKDAEIEIVIKNPSALEIYWDDKRLGWYRRKKPPKVKTTIGKHTLKIKGELIHATIFELNIDEKGKYILYLNGKYNFWKSNYTIFMTGMDLL